jgi:hypothetical protein
MAAGLKIRKMMYNTREFFGDIPATPLKVAKETKNIPPNSKNIRILNIYKILDLSKTGELLPRH